MYYTIEFLAIHALNLANSMCLPPCGGKADLIKYVAHIFLRMSMPGGDQNSDSGNRVEYVEIDGKLQPAPKGMTTDLTIAEETLWQIQITNGILKKETETWKLTNLRAMRGCQYVMLKDCDDVVAVNIRKKLGGSVGDVQFIKQRAPAITFAGVKDPLQPCRNGQRG